MKKRFQFNKIARALVVSCFLPMFMNEVCLAEDNVPNINLEFPQEAEKNSNAERPAGASDLTKPVAEQTAQKQTELILNARLTEKSEDISQGLIWRIFQPVYGVDNKLPLVATVDGGTAHVNLEPGSYIVHVSFGRASVMKRVTVELGQKLSETLVLDAGGLELNATLPEGKINPQYLRFTIYSDDSENDDTALILSDVKPGVVVRLKAGSYHIVSYYGTANAVSRSDIRVEAGKITEATMQHHAALVTLKLVRQEGGEALADTSWSITNDSGDIVRETVGAYASLVLTEGDYVAIAKNKDQIYQKTFSVASGHDQDVDVVVSAENTPPIDDSMD